jgi:hypothetical protein
MPAILAQRPGDQEKAQKPKTPLQNFHDKAFSKSVSQKGSSLCREQSFASLPRAECMDMKQSIISS